VIELLLERRRFFTQLLEAVRLKPHTASHKIACLDPPLKGWDSRQAVRSKNQWPDYNGQVANDQRPLELPPARDAEVLVAEADAEAAVDDQARRGEAPNNQVGARNGFFTTRESPGMVIETSIS